MKKIDMLWILITIGICAYFIVGGWSEVKKDTDSFSIKIVCKNCGSENCNIGGFGDLYDSGIYISCEDCDISEEVSNNGN